MLLMLFYAFHCFAYFLFSLSFCTTNSHGLHQQSDLENQVQQDLTKLSHQVMAKFATPMTELNDRMGSLENLLNSKLSQLGKKLQKIKHFLQDDSKSSRKGSGLAAVEGADSERETPSPANVGSTLNFDFDILV